MTSWQGNHTLAMRLEFCQLAEPQCCSGMALAVPGLNVKRGCPWSKKTGRASKQARHAKALEWVVLVSKAEVNSRAVAWCLVRLEGGCVLSSPSGTYDDLELEELMGLTLMRQDRRFAQHLVDEQMLSWRTVESHPLVEATEFEVANEDSYRFLAGARASGWAAGADTLGGRRQAGWPDREAAFA